MAKTREIYQVRVYFSKDEYLEWKDVKNLDWPDDNCVQFTDQTDQEITVVAQVIVVTKKEEVITRY